MKDTVKHYFKIVLNILSALLFVLIAIFILPKVIVFFMPFVIGWIIACMAHPTVLFIEKNMKIRRKATSAVMIGIVVVLVALLVYGAVSLLISQIVELYGMVPAMWESVQAAFTRLGDWFGTIYFRLPLDVQDGIGNFTQSLSSYIGEKAGGLGTPTVNAVGNIAKYVPNVIVAIIMGLLSAYFFTTEKESVVIFIKKYTPQFIQEKWSIVWQSISSAVGGYFKAQFKIAIWMYLLVLVGLSILKVKSVFVIALGIAVLDLLPVFGAGTVLIPWSVIRFLEGDVQMGLGLLILYLVGMLMRQIIQPKIVGDEIGLATLPTLIFIYIGWQLRGVMGMIIAVPVGVLVINLNKAGVFDGVKESFHILARDITAFRKYNEGDKTYYKHYLKENGIEESEETETIKESDEKNAGNGL